MKLRNRGLIFDLSEFEPLRNYEFAQAPQLVQMKNRNRIYFSARKFLPGDKLPMTVPLFVDFDADFKEIIGYSENEIISPGELGSFDEHGIFPIHVFRNNGEWLAYLSGWSRRISVPVETSIGLAKSWDDGVSFQRVGNGPVLSASINEPFLVGDPYVLAREHSYFMFYIAGKRWLNNPTIPILERVYKIRMAISDDGINWSRQNSDIITNVIDENECQALPSVTPHNGRYLMSFCFRNAFDFRTNPIHSYRIGFAFSENLYEWKRDDSLFEIDGHPSNWDIQMKCYPNINIYEGKVLLLYNGNNFGRKGFGIAIEE